MTSHIGNSFFYSVFFMIVAVMLAIDLFGMKKSGVHKVSTKEALSWSLVWIVVSGLFAIWLYFQLASDPNYGHQFALTKVMEFLTGYVLEKSLAIDNIFIFLMIFSYFKIPAMYQHKVLLYGVIGAIIMRIIMIAVGAILISQYEWILYIFGSFLIFSGLKIFFNRSEHGNSLDDNRWLNLLKRHLPLTSYLEGEKFYVIENGKRLFTPLFLVLILIEVSDLIFAVDSIPAVFAVTTDPFIVLTSNILAILGLRAMYFLLADIADKFIYLKYGLAIILVFIGIKMLVLMFDIHLPIGLSLSFVLLTLCLSIVASLIKKI